MAGLFSAPFGKGQFAEAIIAANVARQRLKPVEEKVFAAFGRFIAAYALAEAAFHIAARQFSGMSEDNARIVFAGMRLRDLVERTRPLIKDASTLDSYEELRVHLDEIGRARDQFVHRRVTFDGRDGLEVTNFLTCRTAELAEPQSFTLAELEGMTVDCERIFGRMVILCDRLDDLARGQTDTTLAQLFGPWRYKPPRPAQKNPATRAARKSARRQPSPSPSSPPDREPKT